MIVVTGANGTLGRSITERLLDRVPADQVAVSVREPDLSEGLRERGVRVRRGDFADPASLADAFAGATQVLIVSAGALGDAAVRMNRAAIDAAAAAGAKRILYTSHMGASATSYFPPMRTHAASESALEQSGVPYTALRNGFYTSTVLRLLGDAARTGELAVPQDGPVSWTAHADLADAAVVALTQPALDGVSPALTAAASIDMAEVAHLMSELTGRAIRHRVVPDEDYRAGLLAHGAPVPVADLLLSMFEASRRDEFAAADATLPRLLERSPLTVRDVLAATLPAHPERS